MSVILACDLGATSFRAALVDEAGRISASHAIVMPVEADRHGRSEIDPELWWQSFAQSAEALKSADAAAFATVRAVAVSALTRSQVFLGHDGRVLRPAMLLRDTRADALLPELKTLCPPDHPEAPGLSAFHPLARLHWLKQAEPAAFAALAHVLEPKDYLNFKLTGVVASDPISLARLAASAQPQGASGDLFSAAGLESSVIPPFRSPVSVMGRVAAGLDGALAGLAGIPVVTMANDTWASVVGLGALRHGVAYNLSGTTEVSGLVTRGIATAEGLLTVDWSGGDGAGSAWQLGGPSQTGGDTLVWLLELLGRYAGNPKAMGGELDVLLDGPRDSDPLLFLPFLQGERVPYWDPSLRGAFVGLNRRHGSTDLAWAVLEGIAFLNRLVLTRAEAASCVTMTELRFGGGGAANPRWRQLKADVLGRTVACVPGEEHGLLGAAIVAWTAIGAHPDLEAAQAALVGAGERYRPRPQQRAYYERLFPLFEEACAAVNPVARKLSGWQSIA